MRKWWKILAVSAGCLAGSVSVAMNAVAQIPGAVAAPMSIGGSISQPGHAGQSGGPGQQMGPVCLPNDGSPNSFSEWENCYPWSRPVFWISAEGVYGVTRRAPSPTPFCTSSTAPDVTNNVGAIGQSATYIPGNQTTIDLRNPTGVYCTVGFSPTVEWKIPFECNFLYLHDQITPIAVSSDVNGVPLLGRPVFSTTPGDEGEKVYLSSFPNLAVGSIIVESSLQLMGIDGRGIVQTGLQWGCDDHGCALDIPIGVRYLEMNEVINVSSSVTPTNPVFALPFLGVPFGQGDRTIVTDMFKCNNSFLGGELGIRLESRWNRFSMVVEPRCSVGTNRQSVFIDGNSVLQQQNNPAVVAPGGILAVASNSGIHTRERFAYLPEGSLHIGWDVFPWMRIQVGYNIIYWENVVRPGEHVNRAVDVRQVPTDFAFTGIVGNSPTFQFVESNFLLQTASIGITFSF